MLDETTLGFSPKLVVNVPDELKGDKEKLKDLFL
jgi:hypothetical protein